LSANSDVTTKLSRDRAADFVEKGKLFVVILLSLSSVPGSNPYGHILLTLFGALPNYRQL